MVMALFLTDFDQIDIKLYHSKIPQLIQEPNSKFYGSLSFDSRVWHPCELK